MNTTKKTLTTLAVAAALASGITIAQTSTPSTDAGASPPNASQTAPTPGADTSSSSTPSSSSATDSSTLSNSDSGKVAQADRN